MYRINMDHFVWFERESRLGKIIEYIAGPSLGYHSLRTYVMRTYRGVL